MEKRIWQFGLDDKYIPSFLDGMSIAHGEKRRSEEWFHWKFEQSPYGKAILACAFDESRVAGCVAYGIGELRYKGKEYKCALSYETFVHPDYQGQGLFKKLILLAEHEMSNAGIQFLYNFPNANSITGFKHMNWICRNDIRCFKIRIVNYLNVLFHLNDLKNSFHPNSSNIERIRYMEIKGLKCEETNIDMISPVWTDEYLKWRFFTYPNREYFVVNNANVFGISMVGHRGSLKCIHILYAIDKNTLKMKDALNIVIRLIKKEENPDIIEYGSTIFDESIKNRWGFFKVHAHGNFCYKVLDEEMKIDDFKIVLPSINAHTY